MVGDVFVEVRQNQQQFEHPVALTRIGHSRAFFEVFHNRQRICKQPFQVARIHGAALAAAIERVVSAQERFVEKMIEAQPFGGEGGGIELAHGVLRQLPGAAAFMANPKKPRRKLRGKWGEPNIIFAKARNIDENVTKEFLGRGAVALLVLLARAARARIVSSDFCGSADGFGSLGLCRTCLELQVSLLAPLTLFDLFSLVLRPGRLHEEQEANSFRVDAVHQCRRE